LVGPFRITLLLKSALIGGMIEGINGVEPSGEE